MSTVSLALSTMRLRTIDGPALIQTINEALSRSCLHIGCNFYHAKFPVKATFYKIRSANRNTGASVTS